MTANLRKIASAKADQFQESVIREMSRLSVKFGAVNLAQGLPDFPCPPELKEAAKEALFADVNQYAITWGDRQLRQAIADKAQRTYGMTVDPDTQITVTCGATEAMVATMLALVDPSEEVIVFEPHYENYGPDAILSGATPRYVMLHAPSWSFDFDELEAAFNDKTRAIIINSPHNPTGKIFTPEELQFIANLCQKWNVLAITDDIYEHICFDGRKFTAIATFPGMEDRTVTINSLSKTYSVTGWRIGWAIASKELTLPIRKVHDFLTVGAPAPLQRAAVSALHYSEKFYDELLLEYVERRNYLFETLDAAGITYFKPDGAYYILADISNFGFETDLLFTKHLIENIGVAVVPGSSFYGDPANGSKYVRFCFSRRMETLLEARKRLTERKSELFAGAAVSATKA